MSLRQQVLRGGAYLAVRQVVGTAINIGGILLLTRTIGPSEYGLYAAALAVYAYLHLLAQWGVQVYLVRREGADDPAVYHQAFTLLALLGVGVTALAFAALPLLERWVRLETFAPVAAALFPVLTLHLVGLVPLARLERALDYRKVAWIELTAQTAFFAVALPLALAGFGAWSAVAGWWTQQASAAGLSFVAARYRPRLRWDRAILREMTGYGLGYSASIWVWQLRRLVNPLVVGRYLGADAVGFVALAIQIASNLSFASSAVWRISTAALAKVQGEPARLARAISEGMRLQVLAVGPLLVGFALVAPWLVPLFFGESWTPVVRIYPFIAVAYLAFAVFNLHSSALYVLRHNWDVTVYHVVHSGLFFGAALLLVPRMGIEGYGWAEIVTLAGYVVIHAYTARRIAPPSYRLVAPLFVAFALPLFWTRVGWWTLLLPLAVLLWPQTRAEVRGLVAGLRGLAYER